jgi:hypothetical protein
MKEGPAGKKFRIRSAANFPLARVQRNMQPSPDKSHTRLFALECIGTMEKGKGKQKRSDHRGGKDGELRKKKGSPFCRDGEAKSGWFFFNWFIGRICKDWLSFSFSFFFLFPHTWGWVPVGFRLDSHLSFDLHPI